MRRLLFCMIALVTVFAPLSGAAGGASAEGKRGAAVAFAAETAERFTTGPGLPVWLNGKELDFSPPAATVNGTLFVPAVRLAAALGLQHEAAGGEYFMNAMKATSGGTTVTVRLGDMAMDRNGEQVPLPGAPYADDDWLYVPLRPFAEAFGYNVRWDELKREVVMEKEWEALPAVGTEAKLKELLGGAGAGEFDGSMKVTMMDQRAAAPSPAAADADGGAAKTGSASAAPQAAATAGDYSQTNVQVAGVDEGDLVKTDGAYLYQISGRRLVLTRINPAAEMKVAAAVQFDDELFAPRELYVDGDKLVVIGRSQKPGPNVKAAPENTGTPAARAQPDAPVSSAAGPAAPAQASGTGTIAVQPLPEKRVPISVPNKIVFGPIVTGVTKAIVYDIADRSSPKPVRTVELDGNTIATRKIGSVVYLVANAPAYNYRVDLKASSDAAPPTPSYRDSASGSDWRNAKLPGIRYFPGPIRPNYLLIGGFDLKHPERPLALSSFLGSGQTVYVSDKSLYVAQTNYGGSAVVRPFAGEPAPAASTPVPPDNGGPKTTVYRFRLDGGSVRFAAQGDVPGTPLNQFSMDEYDDVFRIATTRPDGNALYTLDESMQTIGRLEKLAPGERIYSARFMGSRAYLVTFRQVDPLFAIDVSDPRSPAVLGALKIPGYSDYLHPYDATHLIGFGKETVQDDKTGAVLYQGMKVSLFDVSDVTRPVELFKTNIGDRGTESDLLRDHKALLFSKDKGLLAFPVSVREAQAKDGYKDPHQYGALTFQGAYVYHIDLQAGFELRGRITHLTAQDQLKAGYDSFDPAYVIKRALYVGDTLYTVSDGAVKASDLATLGEVGQLRFGDR
ncbi:beta-propeller domain-containing protein [Gordoniibacillus kamchatkensis]|uniref:beta-propeller domain-containing protein n=1 Tax=Gordoniibacillus kamchatkensis TaxID=1590651 RepID=UPI000696125F|nr:beta-propeller domain-containing protein [Paenibacillus sp. VKM B-2647]